MKSLLTVLDSCDGCGACCMEQESPPGYVAYLVGTFPLDGSNDARRVRALPLQLKQQLLHYAEQLRAGKPHPNNGICLWYDERSKKCKHHGMRPQICRDFDRGSDGCHEWRKTYHVG